MVAPEENPRQQPGGQLSQPEASDDRRTSAATGPHGAMVSSASPLAITLNRLRDAASAHDDDVT
jgi:hypothetical protein